MVEEKTEFNKRAEKQSKDRLTAVKNDPKDVARYVYTAFEIAQGSADLQGLLAYAETMVGAADELKGAQNLDNLDFEVLKLLDGYNLPGKHLEVPSSDIHDSFSDELDVFIKLVGGDKYPRYEAYDDIAHDPEEIAKNVLLSMVEIDHRFQQETRPGREESVSPEDYDTRKDPHASYLRRFLVKGDTRMLHETHRQYLERYLKPVYEKYNSMSVDDFDESQKDTLDFKIVKKLENLEERYELAHSE